MHVSLLYADSGLWFEALFLKVSSIVGSHVDQDDFHYDMIFYIFSISVGVHSEFV